MAVEQREIAAAALEDTNKLQDVILEVYSVRLAHFIAVLLLNAPAFPSYVDHLWSGIVGEFVGMVIGIYHAGIVHLPKGQLVQSAVCKSGYYNNHLRLSLWISISPNLTQNQSHLVAQAVVNIQRLLLIVLFLILGIRADDRSRYYFRHGLFFLSYF